MVKQDKEIHFYSYSASGEVGLYYSWLGTDRAIKSNKPLINTVQMGLLSTNLFERGYRIFIHESKTDSYEIKLGDKNERTDKQIRLAHNLFKMWKAGTFSKKETL